MRVHEVPDGFVRELQRLPLPELLVLAKELARFPEDAKFLQAARDEMQKRIRA